MDETELMRIEANVISNVERISAIESVALRSDGEVYLELREMYDEVQDLRETLRGLERMLDNVEDGMYDTAQLLGDLRDLLC